MPLGYPPLSPNRTSVLLTGILHDNHHMIMASSMTTMTNMSSNSHDHHMMNTKLIDHGHYYNVVRTLNIQPTLIIICSIQVLLQYFFNQEYVGRIH